MKKNRTRPKGSKPDDPKPPGRVRLYSEFVPLVERIIEAAKGGDAAAAAVLVEGAHMMALSVECLFKSSHEAEETIRKIAAKRLLWPVVASPINEEHGPDWIHAYLGKLKLGAGLNVSPRKPDNRTQGETIALVHLMQLAGQWGMPLTRAGIKSRNEWMKSEHGKAAGKAVKHGLKMLYEGDGWLDCPILRPLVSKARKQAESADRKRNGRERNEPAKATKTAIKTAFFKEALSLIHGRLGD